MAATASNRSWSSSEPQGTHPETPQVLKTVAPPARSGGTALLTALAVLLGGLFVAGVRMETVQLTYELDGLARQKQVAQADAARLRADMAALHSPEHLGPSAAAMGLQAPNPSQVRRVDAP